MMPIISLPQAIFCASISFFCMFICLTISYKTVEKQAPKYILISFITFNTFIVINCLSEFFAFFISAFTTEYYALIVHIYLTSLYGFAFFFLWFCTCLNGKANWWVLGVCCAAFFIFSWLQYQGELINGFTWNGFTLIRVPGVFYPLFEGVAAFMLLTVFVILFKNALNKDADIRSRSIITLFAASPLFFIMTLILILMKFSDNYAPVIFLPVFFAWMNLFLMLATSHSTIDVSFSKQHIQAYRLLLESASTKQMDIPTRMAIIEEAWYMLAAASSYGDINEMAKRLDTNPDKLYKNLEETH